MKTLSVGDKVFGSHGHGKIVSLNPSRRLPYRVKFVCGYEDVYAASELEHGSECNCAHRRRVFQAHGVIPSGLEYIPVKEETLIAALELTKARFELYDLLHS